ncbi:hypothetical protein ES703_79800 [subsurface metagenome]
MSRFIGIADFHTHIFNHMVGVVLPGAFQDREVLVEYSGFERGGTCINGEN